MLRTAIVLMFALAILPGCRENHENKQFYDTDALEALKSLFDAEKSEYDERSGKILELQGTTTQVTSSSPFAIRESNLKKKGLRKAHRAALDEIQKPIDEAEAVLNEAIEAENSFGGQVYVGRAGRTCGDDSCGGSCGDCKDSELCHGGFCHPVPDCAGVGCGNDRLRFLCGVCDEGQVCSRSRECVPVGEEPAYDCNPVCGGKEKQNRRPSWSPPKDYADKDSQPGASIDAREDLAAYETSIQARIKEHENSLKELANLAQLQMQTETELTALELGVTAANDALKAAKDELKNGKKALKALKKQVKGNPALQGAFDQKMSELDTLSERLKGELKDGASTAKKNAAEKKKELAAIKKDAKRRPAIEKSIGEALADLRTLLERIQGHGKKWDGAIASTKDARSNRAKVENTQGALRKAEEARYEKEFEEWKTAHEALVAPIISEAEEIASERLNRIRHDVDVPGMTNDGAYVSGLNEASDQIAKYLDEADKALEEAKQREEEESTEDEEEEEEDAPEPLSVSELENLIEQLKDQQKAVEDSRLLVPALMDSEERAYGLRQAVLSQRELHIP